MRRSATSAACASTPTRADAEQHQGVERHPPSGDRRRSRHHARRAVRQEPVVADRQLPRHRCGHRVSPGRSEAAAVRRCARRHGAARRDNPASRSGSSSTTRRRRAPRAAPRRSPAASSSSSTAIAGARSRSIGSVRPSVSGEIGGVWNRQAVSALDLQRHVSTRGSADVGDVARTAALFGFSTPAIVRNSRGPLDANITLSGEFNAPRFVGSATQRRRRRAVARDGRRSPPTSTRRHAPSTSPTSTARSAPRASKASASPIWRRARLAARSAIEAPSARELLTMLPEALRLDGPLSATATLGGTVDAPDIVGERRRQRHDARRPTRRLADRQSAHRRRRRHRRESDADGKARDR